VATSSNILPANVAFGLIPSLKDAVTISDTANGATVTINIGSAVFYPDAGGTVTFPSGTVAGLAYATKYYIKRTGVDPVSAPTGTGWSASTTLTIGVGDVYVNYFTTRATSGSPSPPPPPPPGGGQDCVAADAWVETRDAGWRPASEIEPGDMLRVLTDDLAGTRWEPCTSNHVAEADRVELVTDQGFRLKVAKSTPLTLPGGEIIRAPEALGRMLPIFTDRLVWDMCREVNECGAGPVAHIRCSQKTYSAGTVAGKGILTHNPAKP
jgi:hypothetical protein